MSLLTTRELRKQAKQLDTLNKGVADTVAKMRRGATLHCAFENRGRHPGPRWWLDPGGEVPVEVAELVVVNEHVVAVGRVLFDDLFSQTYRHTG